MRNTMDLTATYMEIRPQDIAYVKFIFESYEEVGVIRTIDRKKAVIVLLAVRDFVDVAREIIKSLAAEIPLNEIPRPADPAGDWLMNELAAQNFPD